MPSKSKTLTSEPVNKTSYLPSSLLIICVLICLSWVSINFLICSVGGLLTAPLAGFNKKLFISFDWFGYINLSGCCETPPIKFEIESVIKAITNSP